MDTHISEEKAKPLSPQRAAFVNAYLTEAQGNGTKAAILAGYSEATAPQIASRLLKQVEVRQAIDARLAKADLTTQARLAKLAKIADHTPDKIKAADVVAANKLILQVNGALKDKQPGSGITVNIGFISTPDAQRQPIDGLTISTAIDAQVMPPQAQIAASEEPGG